MRRVVLIASFLAVPIIAIASYIYIEDRTAQKIAVQIYADDARVISHAIHQYTVDKGRPPRFFDDLVNVGYLKAIPGRRPMYSDPIPLQKGRV
jgi:hypothetical protein